MAEKEYAIELTVDGKRVGMNAFVKSVFIKVILGLVESLKNTDDPEQIVVKIAL
jgi:hypothetical protein